MVPSPERPSWIEPERSLTGAYDDPPVSGGDNEALQTNGTERVPVGLEVVDLGKIIPTPCDREVHPMLEVGNDLSSVLLKAETTPLPQRIKPDIFHI